MIATRSTVDMGQGATPNLTHPTLATVQGYYAAMRRFWHPVMPASELVDDEPNAVELLAEELVLVRLNGEAVAMQDLCGHFQAKLSLGQVRHVRGKGDCLMC